MADESDVTIEEAIAESAKDNVRSVSVDGLTVQTHSIGDQIKADRYAKEQAAQANPGQVLRAFKLKPPGTA